MQVLVVDKHHEPSETFHVIPSTTDPNPYLNIYAEPRIRLRNGTDGAYPITVGLKAVVREGAYAKKKRVVFSIVCSLL